MKTRPGEVPKASHKRAYGPADKAIPCAVRLQDAREIRTSGTLVDAVSNGNVAQFIELGFDSGDHLRLTATDTK